MKLNGLAHLAIRTADLEKTLQFYTEVMGFRVSDVYTPDVAPGGMVFLRCNADHHGVALVGSMPPDPPSA